MWSCFPLRDSQGDITNEETFNQRTRYTHEQYIRMTASAASEETSRDRGRLTDHNYDDESTEEDPRMIALFDSLIERTQNDWASDTDSDDVNSESNGGLGSTRMQRIIRLLFDNELSSTSSNVSSASEDDEDNSSVGGRATRRTDDENDESTSTSQTVGVSIDELRRIFRRNDEILETEVEPASLPYITIATTLTTTNINYESPFSNNNVTRRTEILSTTSRSNGTGQSSFANLSTTRQSERNSLPPSRVTSSSNVNDAGPSFTNTTRQNERNSPTRTLNTTIPTNINDINEIAYNTTIGRWPKMSSATSCSVKQSSTIRNGTELSPNNVSVPEQYSNHDKTRLPSSTCNENGLSFLRGEVEQSFTSHIDSEMSTVVLSGNESHVNGTSLNKVSSSSSSLEFELSTTIHGDDVLNIEETRTANTNLPWIGNNSQNIDNEGALNIRYHLNKTNSNFHEQKSSSSNISMVNDLTPSTQCVSNTDHGILVNKIEERANSSSCTIPNEIGRNVRNNVIKNGTLSVTGDNNDLILSGCDTNNDVESCKQAPVDSNSVVFKKVNSRINSKRNYRKR